MNYQIAAVEGMGLGLILEEHAHYAIIEFRKGGVRWQLVFDSDEYEIYDQIRIGSEEIM